MQEQDTCLNEDWKVIESLLPEGWEEKAKELGAICRFRAFSKTQRGRVLFFDCSFYRWIAVFTPSDERVGESQALEKTGKGLVK